MYSCKECGCWFDEPILVKTTYENYYGVGGLFPDHHALEYEACPCCRGEDFKEVEEDEEDEEI